MPFHAGLSVDGDCGGMLMRSPRVDVRAWFTLAVTGPAALLALGAAATTIGTAQLAGKWATLILGLMFLLAVSRLERSRTDPSLTERPGPARDREQALLAAVLLTSTEASGVLLCVLAGLPLSGESIAAALTVASLPLCLALPAYAAKPAIARLSLDAHLAPSERETTYARRETREANPEQAGWMWSLGPEQTCTLYIYNPIEMAQTPETTSSPPAELTWIAPAPSRSQKAFTLFRPRETAVLAQRAAA
jgi:hypothetical protein